MKHAIIKEFMVICEYCPKKESFNNYYHYDNLKEARRSGWCIRKGKTCCPECKNKINKNG